MLKCLILSLFVIIGQCFVHVEGLQCFSCSTSVGDSYCSEDTFDKHRVPVNECPNHSDVCVRLKKISDGSIFRSCGTSSSAEKPEVTEFGFYPLKNACINYKSNSRSVFPDAEFEVCSCDKNLSNFKGEMKC